MPSLLACRPVASARRAAMTLCVAVLLPAARAQTTIPAPVPASAAALSGPSGLVFDTEGNLLFAEATAHLVRRLDREGMLTPVAGTAVQGFGGDGGPATQALLNAPHAVALDSDGTLFIADTGNHRVRRVDPRSGLITTVAGTGIAGFSGENGPGTQAQLAAPLALALDSAHHLFLADSGNHRIRRLDLQAGTIVTVAGTGLQGFSGDGASAISAALDTPSGLTLDPVGNLFLADTGNHRIRRVDAATGVITTITGGMISTSPLARPLGLVLSPRGLLITDAAAHRILLQMLPSGPLTVVAGEGTQSFAGDGGPASKAMLDRPSSIAASSAGELAIADTGNSRLRQVAADGSIATIAGINVRRTRTLLLAGASLQAYGSTRLAASLLPTSAAPATGSVTLFERSGGSTSTIAQAPLIHGMAAFESMHLPVGTHQLFATFQGDSGSLAEPSPRLTLDVSPRPLIASVTVPALVFGEAIPELRTELAGVLPADVGEVDASSATTATERSTPGMYPIQTTLSGARAGNYTLAATTALLVIAKAPVVTTLANTTGSLIVQVSSITTGTPTGAITLLSSAGAVLSTVPVNSSGSAVLSNALLSDGAYTITAIYSGDSDFLAAQSLPLSFTVGQPVRPPDFTLAAESTSPATVSAGGTSVFRFAVQTSGSLDGPIALSVSGLPPSITANFDPALIPPGGGVDHFTLTVATPRSTAGARSIGFRSGALIALGCLLPLLRFGRSRRLGHRVLLGSLWTLALCGCGARVNTNGATQLSAKVYTITVTGTSTRLDGSVLQRTAVVTLSVE